MKKSSLYTIICLWQALFSLAQQKSSLAVLAVESRGIINDPQEVAFMVRLELEKNGSYVVMDKYEVTQVLKNAKYELADCMTKSCMADAGKILQVDKVVQGSIERFGEKIIITLRMIDVKTAVIEKTNTTEYLNLPELQKMIGLSVAKLTGTPTDPNLEKLLVDYDLPIESPKNGYKLNGPRMGLNGTFGEAYSILTGTNKNKGEFGMYPVNFVFGWQQEFQYISAGNFQALVENIFTVGGLESQRFIPSYSPLLGFRFGNGFEFGFGPNFRIIRKAKGYYENNVWHLTSEWDFSKGNNPNSIEDRIDSRGSINLSTGLIIAVGKTFRSGYLNIPLNVYAAPRKDGTTVGIMIGFNIQKNNRFY